MTPEQATVIWPIAKAYSEGKKIEVMVGRNEWREPKPPFAFIASAVYRIKTEK